MEPGVVAVALFSLTLKTDCDKNNKVLLTFVEVRSMRKWRLMMSGLLGLVLLLALACGGAAATTKPPQVTVPPPVTDTTSPPVVTQPPDGEAIFTVSGGCSACHTIEGVTAGLLGPDLTHIGTDAGTRKPGFSAEEYIFESIRKPEVFVAEGVERATPGLMLSALTANLTDGQVDALVEFLLKQK